MRGDRLAAAAVLLLCIGLPTPSFAFTLLGDPTSIPNIRAAIENAARWPSADGSKVLLHVASMPGFGAAIGTTAEEIAVANQVVADAFASWESASVDFDVQLGNPGVTGLASPDPSTGFDIDVFAVSSAHPVWGGTGTTFFGMTVLNTSFSITRRLTNGSIVPGQVIDGADVYLNLDSILPLKTGVVAIDRLALIRLLAHEIGHGLGLGHPNNNNPYGVAVNLDSDSDPLNVMAVNGADPAQGILASPNPHNECVMSNRPCGQPPVLPCLAMINPLQNDDLGGRSVLYPVDGALDPSERKCVEAMASGAALIAATQGSVARTCIHHTAVGDTQKLADPQRPMQLATPQACLTNDVARKIEKKNTQLFQRELAKCNLPDGPPPFGKVAAPSVIQAATGSSLDAISRIFSANLNAGVIALKASSPAANACQETVARHSAKLQSGVWKLAKKGLHNALVGRIDPATGVGPSEPVGGSLPLAAEMLALLVADPGARLATANGKLTQAIQSDCAGVSGLAALFPTCAPADPTTLASCVSSRSRCTACLGVAESLGISIGCDSFDDGAVNSSCVP